MLHPSQFSINEAWVAFQLNEAPIQIGSGEPVNCVALMDAASCFVLMTILVPAGEPEPSEAEAKKMFNQAYSHKQQMPATLFIPAGYAGTCLEHEAERHNATVIRIPEDQLAVFIGEARQAFAERFGGYKH